MIFSTFRPALGISVALRTSQCTAEIDDQERLLTHKDGVARIKIAQLLQRVIAWNFAAAQPSSAFFTSAI